jgi:hypothetical protein
VQGRSGDRRHGEVKEECVCESVWCKSLLARWRECGISFRKVREMIVSLFDDGWLSDDSKDWHHVVHMIDGPREVKMIAFMMWRVNDYDVQRALDQLGLWTRAWNSCRHRGSWESWTPSLLTQLLKATGTSLHEHHCLTIFLYLASWAPASVCHSESPVGFTLLKSLSGIQLDADKRWLFAFPVDSVTSMDVKPLLFWGLC